MVVQEKWNSFDKFKTAWQYAVDRDQVAKKNSVSEDMPISQLKNSGLKEHSISFFLNAGGMTLIFGLKDV